MDEDANIEVTVFLAEITSMCGLESDGIAALLSACLLVRCCNRQFIFGCLQMLFQSTPPLFSVSCKVLPAYSVDVDSLHISHADIFILQVRIDSGSPPQCQLTVA